MGDCPVPGLGGVGARASDSGAASPSIEKTANSCGSVIPGVHVTLRRDFASLVSSGSVSTGTCA